MGVAVLVAWRSNGLFDHEVILANHCLRRAQGHDNHCVLAGRTLGHKWDPLLQKR